jgi:predicted RND superfamily exporter protein
MTRSPKPGKTGGFYARYGGWIVLLAFLFTPACFYCAARAVATNINKVEDWLPKTFRETHELAWFRMHFPTDQFVLISWEGCQLADPTDANTIDDPRIAKLASLLTPSGALNTADAAACEKYFKSVSTGRDVLNRLVEEPLKIDPEEAVRRLQGSVLGPDGRQTCIVVSLTEAATKELKAVLGRGQYRIFRPSVPPGILRRQIAAAGIADSQMHLGGPPVDNISIDEEGERTLMRLAGVSALLGIFLAWWSLRSIYLTWVVFACGVLSAATSLGIIWLTGETVDAIVLSMPSLVYVLAISGAVHLINYFRDAVLEGGEQGAAGRAAAHAFKPAILCTATTAFGLISLCASELTPIRKFGLYAALGVIATLFIVFVFLPAALQIGNVASRWAKGRKKEDELDVYDVLDVRRMTALGRFWYRWANFVQRRHFLVAATCTACIALCALGLTRIRTSIDLLELFDSQARILQDYRWLEQHLGMLVPLEIVVKFSPESQDVGNRGADRNPKDLFQLTFLERMETTSYIQERIDKEFGVQGQGIVGRSLSAATFAPALPDIGADSATVTKRYAFNEFLGKSREQFQESGFLRIAEDGSELWRISLRVAAFHGVDYGLFVDELEKTVRPIMEAHARRVHILSELTRGSTEGKYVGSKVFLWDKPSKEKPSTPEEVEIGRHHAMVDALMQLLVKARIKVGHGEADPDLLPVTRVQQLNQQWDRIALVGPFSNSQVETIRWAVPNVIDLHGPLAVSTARGTEVVDGKQPWLSTTYTGVVPIVYKAQRALLTSLVQSTIYSFVTITPLMILVSRGVRSGLVAMLPNMLPTVAIFGLMGWMGIAIDIGSMMSASIALGVAVDDTIHYLSWFREDLHRLKDRRKAVIAAYQRCATPTLQAALISGLGLSVFAFSTFTPTQRFGWLMLTILVAGVVAELIFLPALLCGPLGRVFESRWRFRFGTKPESETTKRSLRQAS